VNELRIDEVEVAAVDVPRPVLAISAESEGRADLPSVGDGMASDERLQADPLGDAVMAELEAATATLAVLGERVKEVASARLALERELTETRSQLAELRAERDAAVERQRVRDESMRVKLADLMSELNG
jgi:hypothetical protein